MPEVKFMLIGRGSVVHTFHTKAYDLKKSQCPTARKAIVAGKIDYKAKGLSPEATLALPDCPRCGTKPIAEGLIPAATKRANRKDARDEVLERAKPKKKGATQRMSENKGKETPKKPKPVSMTKSGPRSVASVKDGDPTLLKAQMLADFGKEHGWSTSISKDDDTGHTVVTAKRGNETITAWFIDGKYDVARHAETRVGSWVGKLRGAHAARRQMAGEGRDRVHPEPGKGRTGPRKSKVEDEVPEDESPEDAIRRVPFLIDDDPAAILDVLLGTTIRWRNGTTGSIEEARLPAEVGKGKRPKISIGEHPKSGKRFVDFLEVAAMGEHGEVYGPERTVALAKIIRVVE